MFIKRPISALLLVFLLAGCTGGFRNERISFLKSDPVIKENVMLDGKNVGGKRISELSGSLRDYASISFSPPVDASVDGKTWEIHEEKPGRQLNIEKTVEALKNAKEGERVDYVFDSLRPLVTADMLRQKIRVIGEYTTVLLDRSDSRVNNIEIASGRINNTILRPGEEFSFNKIVGKRTASKGYEEAPIIVRTPKGPKKKKAKGGGICQVSTTIYNAVEKCGLKVTERHAHSKKVGYVRKGNDATVSYGTVDFRFVNTRSSPIMLRIDAGEDSIRVRILENLMDSW